MNKDNKSLLLEELEAMDDQQLDELLHIEIEKDEKDSEKVLQILSILEAREAGDPNNNVDVDAVRRAYQENLQKDALLLEDVKRKDKKLRRWIGMVAAAAAVVCVLIIAAPKAAGAENIFELFGRWTQSIFGFSNPTDSTETQDEYVFKTDHPGLRQIYDAVTEQGVTQPVVPSWVPEGYELDEIKSMPVRGGKKVYAGLANGENYITIVIEIYDESRTNQYTKDDENVTVYEKEGVKHYLMPNEDSLQAVWVYDNLECAIRTDCNEKTLHKILTSIYEEVD